MEVSCIFHSNEKKISLDKLGTACFSYFTLCFLSLLLSHYKSEAELHGVNDAIALLQQGAVLLEII